MPENGISEAEYALFWEWFYTVPQRGWASRPPDNNVSLLTNPLYRQFSMDTGFKGDLSKPNLASYSAYKYSEAISAIEAGEDKSAVFQGWYGGVQKRKQVEAGQIGITTLPKFKDFLANWQAGAKYDITQNSTKVAPNVYEYRGGYYDVSGTELDLDYVESVLKRGKPTEADKLAREKFEFQKRQVAYEVTQEANKRERERQKEERDVWIRSTQVQYAPYIMQAERLAQEQERWLRGESARDERLSRLSDPRSPTFHKDWVARWQVMYGARYYPTPAPLQTKAYQAQLNINQAKERTLQSAELLKQGVISPQQYEGQVQDYFTTVSEGQPWIAQQQEVARTGQGILGTAGRYWGAEKGGESLSDVGNPPVPAWLSKFAPGQRRTISKENIPTPSAQLWARTSPSEKQGLEGYLDWVNEEAMNGRTMEDILWEMNRMRTGTPSRQAWLPARQRF